MKREIGALLERQIPLGNRAKSLHCPRMRMLKMSLAAVMILLTSGCGEPESESEKASETGQNPLTAPVDYLGAVANAKKSSEGVLALTTLSKAIQMYQAEEGKLPLNLDELIESGYLPRMPKVPYNTKISYDPESGALDIVAAQDPQ